MANKSKNLGTSKIRSKKVLVVGHITESYGPMQSLPDYLLSHCLKFAVISHPFSYCKISKSECRFYVNGKIIKHFIGPRYKKIYIVDYLLDLFLTLFFLIRLGEKWDVMIGSDCLNSFIGYILKSFGFVDKIIFYEHDYTPKRFSNKLLNNFFHFLNGFSARNSDVVWDNPPNLKKIRKEQGADLKRNIRVPHGVDLDKIKIPSIGKINRNRLIYIGYVSEAKGLQLVVSALKNLVIKFPKINVSIVGSGYYEPTLRSLVKHSGLQKNFDFYGYTDHDWTLAFTPKCGIALAPYVNEDEGTFKYAEPLKVKDYLGCGLPVIITKVPSIATEIEKKMLGIAINYDQKELEKAIEKLLTNDSFYNKCRENISDYAKNISWEYTFNNAFTQTFKILKV